MPIQPKVWTREEGAQEAKKNAIIFAFGTSKTGKTNLCTRTNLPLYYVLLDPNNNLNEHLLERTKEGFDGPVKTLVVPPIPYKNLTREYAEEVVTAIEAFGQEARVAAMRSGEPVLFVIDGGKRLKGYVEKWKLGNSATLGWRAKAGEQGINPIEYAESNAYFCDIINAFVGSNSHFIMTFEAREKWAEYTDERGRKARRSTGKYEPKLPSGKDGDLSYSINAMVETLVETVQVAVVDNKPVYEYQHKLRFELIGFVGMGFLKNRTMPAMSFDALLNLLHANIPADQVLDAPHEIQRLDMSEIMVPEQEDEE